MNKLFLTFLLLGVFTTILNAQKLHVHESNRYLETSDGKPFLWLGDTAWELFHKLNREEAAEYLENRKSKGFTVIQAVVLAENDGLRTPNPYGDVPFTDLDPTKPNEKYFEHVDFIVNKAEELGLFVGMLPTWGDKIFSEHPGAGPIVFNKKNAAVYGEFLGKRYREKPIVWILGGDRNIANDEVLEIWQAMAEGIKNGDGSNHLITYHPRGGASSSKSLHNEEWLDFNMYQSGHGQNFNDVYRYAKNDWELEPRKPTLDGEPAYEDIAVKFWEFMDFSKYSVDRVAAGILNKEGLIENREHFKEGYFTGYDVRVHAYWNFLSGACGYTYGNNAIWQMFKKGGEVAIPALYDWRESMDRPGAFDLIHVRNLLEDKFHKIVPNQTLIKDPVENGDNYIAAATSTDNSFALIYLAKGQTVNVVMSKLPGKMKASWFNPRNGFKKKIGEFRNEGTKQFTPSSSGNGRDWMLVFESK
ncbi:MAG: glycoside hydrolase family 140 protein [Bacteroidota bacterium]